MNKKLIFISVVLVLLLIIITPTAEAYSFSDLFQNISKFFREGIAGYFFKLSKKSELNTECLDSECRTKVSRPIFTVFIIKEIWNSSYANARVYSLSDTDINYVLEDLNSIKQAVSRWTNGSLDLQLKIVMINNISLYGYEEGNFLHPAVFSILYNTSRSISRSTDFVQVISKGGCGGGAFGADYGIGGAGYSWVGVNTDCLTNNIRLNREIIAEPLLHEMIHELDWALYNLNDVPDIYQRLERTINWASWNRGEYPACGTAGDPSTYSWFPSPDLCEWDPEWIDCNNQQSFGCRHAGETNEISWYEHLLSEHYPRGISFIGNHCRDGKQNYRETGIDEGPMCWD